MKIAYTIATANYLALAKTVADSFIVHNPEYKFIIGLLDKNNGRFNSGDFGHEILDVEKLAIPFFEELYLKYNTFELSNALKAFYASYLAGDPNIEILLYIDCDILVTDRFDYVEKCLESNSVCITPHVLTTIPEDGLQPDEMIFLNAGLYNGGFIAIKTDAEGKRFIQWWKEKLKNYCFHDVCHGQFVDQLWLNFLPLYFSNVFVIRDPGYNMAYYNLHERTLTGTGSKYLVNGQYKLVFYHFSGIDFTQPEMISFYQSRFDFASRPDIARLYEFYRLAVLKNKQVYYAALIPFYSRPRKQALKKAAQVKALEEKAKEKLRIETRRNRYRLGNVIKKAAETAYKHLLGPAVKKARKSMQYRCKLALQKALSLFQRSKTGINLIGYFSYTSGVAEVGRFFSQYTRSARIPFLIYDVKAPAYEMLDTFNLAQYKPYFQKRLVYKKNMFFINADAIVPLKHNLPHLFMGKYNVAVFFWEFDDYFNFPRALEAVDEVVVFSEFIATAVRKAAPLTLKVTKLPFPFIRNWTITVPANEVRQRLSISHDEFVFIFNFDFLSIYERKNPEAILRAFEMAFEPQDRVRLIFKTIHGDETSASFVKFQKIISAILMKDRVIVLNENLKRDEFMSILNSSDCYISLHRSEGLGLGMMEAMSMGKPVIATAFGGNVDFMNKENSLLVDYTLAEVEEEAGPYKPGWLWAEPNVLQAAGYMGKLYNDRMFAAELGAKAKAYITQTYNEELMHVGLTSWVTSI